MDTITSETPVTAPVTPFTPPWLAASTETPPPAPTQAPEGVMQEDPASNPEQAGSDPVIVETAALLVNNPAVIEEANLPALEGDFIPATVTVTVPKAFKLRIDCETELQIKPGVQQMECEHAEHWYCKAQGVQIYSGQ